LKAFLSELSIEVEVGRRPGWERVPPSFGELVDKVDFVCEINVVLWRLILKHATYNCALGFIRSLAYGGILRLHSSHFAHRGRFLHRSRLLDRGRLLTR
jgi:hypothetical protein